MSGQWFAQWLGLDVSASGEGATWQLDSAWTWAPWVTLVAVALAVAWTVTLYSREQSAAGRAYRGLLVALRLFALAALLIMLAQWAVAVRLTGPPAIAVIFDRSASMSIADRYDDTELAARVAERLSSAGLSDATRLNLAKLVATESDGRWLEQLAERYRLDVYLAAEGVERLPRSSDVAEPVARLREVTAEGAGSQATRLGDAVRRVLADYRGNPPAAIVLLTDGVTTAGPPLADAAQDARNKGVPLVSVGLGSDESPRDVELVDVLVDDAVFVGDLVSFQIQLKASGLEGESARVTLRRAAESETEPLAEETVTLPATGQSLSLQLVDRPATAGDAAYLIEVAARDDETDVENNRQRRVVAVREAKIRVLIVQGYPNYEFRYLKSLLERDSTIDLATYLQDSDPDFAEQDKTALRTFPVGRDEIFSYDVIVVGDVDPRLVPRSVWQHLRAFVVEKGGGLAFVAGPRYLPWMYQDNSDVRTLLPVELEGLRRPVGDDPPEEIARGFAVRPTALGRLAPAMQLGDSTSASERMWQQLAPQYWLVPFASLKPAAQVLATASGPLGDGANRAPLPLVTFQFVGAGRVLLHAIDSTWLWRRGIGETVFARYWVQTVRYLARGKLTGGRGVQLSTDRREYRRGESVQLRARFADPRLAPAAENVTLSITARGRTRQQVSLRRNAAADGIFEGTLGELAEGSYQVLLSEPQLPGEPPEAQFVVVAPPGEFARPEMDRAALTAAAEATGGRFYTLSDAGRLVDELPAGRRVPLENLPPIPIWNRWWLLSVFLICLTGEWILRKRKGML
jgi:hypothetical protein